MKIFGNFQIEFFFNLSNCTFSEFFKFEVSGIAEIGKLRNFEIFLIWKIKVWLQKLAISELIVHSIFRTTRNFAHSHVCPLMHVNQFRRFNFSTFISYSSGNFPD